MSVEAVTIAGFQGLDVRGRGALRSERAPLNTPRELVNFHVDENEHLYMPRAVDNLIYDFGSDRWVRSMHYLEGPRGLIVQLDDGDIYRIPMALDGSGIIEPITAQPLVSMPSGEDTWNIWVNGCGSYGLMGYKPRGSAGPATDGKTWQLEYDGDEGDPLAVTDISGGDVPEASYSMLHKGRRFTVGRGRDVEFSDLNQYVTFGEDSTFKVSGDDAGTGRRDNPGFVQGMVSFEDTLTIFLSNSVWLLTGSTPENFRLRQVQTTIGNARSWTLERTEQGVLTYSGSQIQDRGVYLFTGNGAQKVSTPVDEFFRSLRPNVATFSADRYILAMNQSELDDTQLLIYDLGGRRWTTMDGYRKGAVTQGGSLLISDQGAIYSLAPNDSLVRRAPGRGARVTLGWHDDRNPTGLVRWVGLKLSGWTEGSGSVTATLTVKTPNGGEKIESTTLPSGVFDGHVMPLNIRGSAAEFTLELNPSSDDMHALIESIQLVNSRKGEKVSRG